MNNLFVKSILGLAFLLGFLGVLLFISAGTVNYWQAWLYLAVFGGSTIFVTVYLMKYDQKLLESRVDSGPAAETETSQKVIQSFASVFFILIFVVAGMDQRYGWSSVPTVLCLIGAGLVALGFYFVFLVFKENSYTSAVIEVAADQKVITTGPYAVVRHPMYAGAGIMVVASGLALGSWLAIPCAVLLMVSIGFRAVAEEQYLATHLSGYSEYRQRVRYRIIPYIW